MIGRRARRDHEPRHVPVKDTALYRGAQLEISAQQREIEALQRDNDRLRTENRLLREQLRNCPEPQTGRAGRHVPHQPLRDLSRARAVQALARLRERGDTCWMSMR